MCGDENPSHGQFDVAPTRENKPAACSLLHALPGHNWDHGGWVAKNVPFKFMPQMSTMGNKEDEPRNNRGYGGAHDLTRPRPEALRICVCVCPSAHLGWTGLDQSVFESFTQTCNARQRAPTRANARQRAPTRANSWRALNARQRAPTRANALQRARARAPTHCERAQSSPVSARVCARSRAFARVQCARTRANARERAQLYTQSEAIRCTSR